jgi:hypothetical protein
LVGDDSEQVFAHAGEVRSVAIHQNEEGVARRGGSPREVLGGSSTMAWDCSNGWDAAGLTPRATPS